jgi:putative restriction endonuclease
MDEFDTPLFKILAPNDTGQAPGHQGGIVIPKDLDPYFPQLSKHVTPEQPTVDQFVVAHLFDGPHYVGTVETRYQFQTWGGTRSPERRLTGNLGAIRNLATGGDLLLIERSVSDQTLYRMTLIRKNTQQFNELQPLLEGRRWGALNRQVPPVKEAEVEDAIAAILDHEQKAFSLFDEGAGFTEGRTKRVARSRAFQTRIVELYRKKCAICEMGLIHPGGKCEPHAAHIVPRRLKGADDARNGLLLCRTHHWAFDEGLIGIDQDYRVVIPPLALSLDANASLAAFAKKKIILPDDIQLAPNKGALSWHIENLLIN